MHQALLAGHLDTTVCAAQLPLGEEDDAEDADFAEEEPADDDYFRLGEQDEQFRDYASLALKEDHTNRRARRLSTHDCSCDPSAVLWGHRSLNQFAAL